MRWNKRPASPCLAPVAGFLRQAVPPPGEGELALRIAPLPALLVPAALQLPMQRLDAQHCQAGGPTQELLPQRDGLRLLQRRRLASLAAGAQPITLQIHIVITALNSLNRKLLTSSGCDVVQQ